MQQTGLQSRHSSSNSHMFLPLLSFHTRRLPGKRNPFEPPWSFWICLTVSAHHYEPIGIVVCVCWPAAMAGSWPQEILLVVLEPSAGLTIFLCLLECAGILDSQLLECVGAHGKESIAFRDVFVREASYSQDAWKRPRLCVTAVWQFLMSTTTCSFWQNVFKLL